MYRNHRWHAAIETLAKSEILAISLSLREAHGAKDWKTWCRYMNNGLSFYLMSV